MYVHVSITIGNKQANSAMAKCNVVPYCPLYFIGGCEVNTYSTLSVRQPAVCDPEINGHRNPLAAWHHGTSTVE